MATARPPPRSLNSVIKRAPVATARKNGANLRTLLARSTKRFGPGTKWNARQHATELSSPYSIASLNAEPVHGYWPVHKPAFTPVFAAENETASKESDSAGEGDGQRWSIDQWLRSSAPARAAFPGGERLTILFDLPVEFSGVVPVAVNAPDEIVKLGVEGATELGVVGSMRLDAMVWGHLRRTARLEAVDGLAPVRSFGDSSLPALKVPLETAVSAWVSNVGYYCGFPASILHFRLDQPDLRQLTAIRWAEFVGDIAKQYLALADDDLPGDDDERRLARKLLRKAPAVDADGRPLLIGHHQDTFSKALSLDVPRQLTNVNAVSLRPMAPAERKADVTVEDILAATEFRERPRFPQLLEKRPPLADLAAMQRSARRDIV